MSSRLIFSFVFFFSLVLTSLPLPTSAASIIPCGRTGADATAEEKVPCTLCHIVIGGKRIIDYGLKIMTVVAIAVIVAMAIFYIVSTGDEGMMTTAKGGIKAAFIGFAVMLGAWLLVNVTLMVLSADTKTSGKPLAGNLVQTSLFQFQCDTSSSAGTVK